MDVAWNGILTCDYERSRPEASHLERELYTRSLITWPAALLGESAPYGTLRRPGIVDIRQADHDWLVGQLHDRLACPHRARAIAAQVAAHRRSAAVALDLAENLPARPSRGAAIVAEASAAIVAVMSAHIVNWLLPEEQWETRMAKLLGNREAARTCIAALSVPASAGHLLARLTAAAVGEPGAMSGQLRHACDRTAQFRDSWLTAAILAAAGDAPALDAVRAMAITVQWAADSEERRRELRERYLRLIAAWCARVNLDPRTVTLADIDALAGAQ